MGEGDPRHQELNMYILWLSFVCHFFLWVIGHLLSQSHSFLTCQITVQVNIVPTQLTGTFHYKSRRWGGIIISSIREEID